MTDRYKFYILLFVEFFLMPYLYLFSWCKNRRKRRFVPVCRKPVTNQKIYVSLHEWGGYPLSRSKKIRGVSEFRCGLQYQLERFKHDQGKYKVDLTLTLSDTERYEYLDKVKPLVNRIINVSNKGMDFAGYKAFYEIVKDRSNAFVILTNSSVNALQTSFLEGYIDYMVENPDVGILGISYNTKCYQSLIRNNFTPHIQSFFLLTTIEVLKEIVKVNRYVFPGAGITYKLLLIRKGEIAFSSLAMKLGYNLAVVLENGSVLKFNRYSQRHIFPFRDMRRCIIHPNLINQIK